MLNWDDLHYFVVLAREGTLSAAARALSVDMSRSPAKSPRWRREAASSSSTAAPASTV